MNAQTLAPRKIRYLAGLLSVDDFNSFVTLLSIFVPQSVPYAHYHDLCSSIDAWSAMSRSLDFIVIFLLVLVVLYSRFMCYIGM